MSSAKRRIKRKIAQLVSVTVSRNQRETLPGLRANAHFQSDYSDSVTCRSQYWS